MEHEIQKNRIMDFLSTSLKKTRLDHTLGVRDTAVKMAEKEGADTNKAELAALMHDMARNLPVATADMYVKNLDLPKRYAGNINLSHSKIAAALAPRIFGIDDDEIIDALSYHTTGRAGMSLLEKIIFLSDAIEPGRNYPGVEIIRAEAENSIDRGCLEALSGTIKHLKNSGFFIDNDTLEAFKYFKELTDE